MNALVRIAVSAVVVVMMIPGLVVEPGPVSEAAGIGALFAIWGIGDEPSSRS